MKISTWRPPRRWLRDLVAWAIVAVAATVPFWVTDLDLQVAATFYRSGGTSGDWPQADQPLFLLLYHGVPIVTATLALASVGLLALPTFHPPAGRWRPYAAMLLCTIVLGPGLLVNGVFKDHWGRPRPRQTLVLGGDHAYVPPLKPVFAGEGKSFPCGHCSVGFSLVAGWFLLRPHSLWCARAVLLVAILAGMLSGMGRMAAGAHYLSDILWAGLLTCLAAWISYFFVLDIPKWQKRLASAPPQPTRRPRLIGGSYAALAIGVVGGSLLATPLGLDVDLRQPLDALPSRARSLIVEADRGDLDLVLVDQEHGQVEAVGGLQGFGLPTNHLEARFDLPSAADPSLRLRVATLGFYTELNGRIAVTFPASAFDLVEVRVEHGDLRIRRTDPNAHLPELRLAVPRGQIERL